MRILELNRAWATPASAYPNATLGRAELRTEWQRSGFYRHYGVPDTGGLAWDFFRARRRWPVKELAVAGQTWMIDDPPHWHAMLDHARHLHGRVLCAGLGLGLIVHALATHAQGPGAKVTAVAVVEREQDVIDLVGPLLPQGLPVRLLCGDWEDHSWEGRAFDGATPDSVLYDLFRGDGRGLVAEALRVMLGLRRRFPAAAEWRVHGFPHEGLAGLADGVLQAETALSPMAGKTGLAV
jgi:hypothetical protein